jgi:hypothetical protein
MVRGVGIALFETSLQTLLQRTVARSHLGRVFANVYGAVYVASCVALVGGGLLLDATSARTVLYASGGAGAAGTLISAGLLARRFGLRGNGKQQIMENAITYCISCTAETSFEADTCPECGTEQRAGHTRPGSGMAAAPPAGWQAARPPASPTGFTVEEP